MLKMIIVDDEAREREGMVHFIPWEKYGIEIVGTAKNGAEALIWIDEKNPDIVFTDIKMPVMDGIELIKRVKKDKTEIEFIVLSGYGEYEFTSQVMEEGVQFYVLKPCNEEKIAVVLEKVKRKIREKRAENQIATGYQDKVKKLLPHAQRQILQNLLLGRPQREEDQKMFLEEIGAEEGDIVMLVSFRGENGFDGLEQFSLENIFVELLGKERLIMTTVIQRDMIFVITSCEVEVIERTVERTLEEYRKISRTIVYAALSQAADWEHGESIYKQTQELLQIGSVEKRTELLHTDGLKSYEKAVKMIADYASLKAAHQYDELLFEACLLGLKMELLGYELDQEKQLCINIMKFYYKAELAVDHEENIWDLLIHMIDTIAQCQLSEREQERLEPRMKEILKYIYQNMENPDLSITYLCKEVLFMNEEYFGRFFYKNMSKKYSPYLQEKRIALAVRLIQFNPNLRITTVAQSVGYPVDGQYMSKLFRKIMGFTFKDYRDMVRKQ